MLLSLAFRILQPSSYMLICEFRVPLCTYEFQVAAVVKVSIAIHCTHVKEPRWSYASEFFYVGALENSRVTGNGSTVADF
jgi:hypothetical protein